MRLSRTIPLAVAAALISGAALAAAPQQAHPPAPPTTIAGKVDAVFGRQIVVTTESGKVLVDLGHHAVQPPITVGEELRLAGKAHGSRLKAQMLTRADGSTVVLREPGKKLHQKHE